VPVVSEEPRPIYPTTDYSSAEESWSTPPPHPVYKEANIKLCRATSVEGVYKENKTGARFKFTIIPGVTEPLRVYLPGRNSCFFWENPNYQGGHRVLTEIEQLFYRVESSSIIQAYTKDNSLLYQPLPDPPGVKLISDIHFIEYNRKLGVILKDNRPWPFVSKLLPDHNLVINSYLPLPGIAKYVEHRYLDWIAADGHLGDQEFFIDLWSPEALVASADPTKDNHPRAQLIRDWEEKWAEQLANPTPKRNRKRNRST
jgi:hypothetical protein